VGVHWDVPLERALFFFKTFYFHTHLPFLKNKPSLAEPSKVARSVKEDLCGFPLFRMSDDGLAHHLPVAGRPSEVELPDGTSVQLDPQLFRQPERLFDDDDDENNGGGGGEGGPEAVAGGGGGGSRSGKADGTAHVALHKMVHAALEACDCDLRRDLATSLLLTGAGSQFK